MIVHIDQVPSVWPISSLQLHNLVHSVVFDLMLNLIPDMGLASMASVLPVWSPETAHLHELVS